MSKGFWDTPISEQSVLVCTTPAVDAVLDESIAGPQHVTLASTASYSACGGSDPIMAWLDMGPTSTRRVARSQLPYDATTAKQSTKRCWALTASNKSVLDFKVRSYNTTGVLNQTLLDGSLSVWVLPANYFGLIQHAIYSAGTVSAGFWMYDGGCHFFAFLSFFDTRSFCFCCLPYAHSIPARAPTRPDPPRP
jgi:hypothetical protein